MKCSPFLPLTSGLLGVLTLCGPGPAQAFTYETPEEISAQLDLNQDGHPDLVLLDRATGAIRELLSLSGVSFRTGTTWHTGLDEADSLTAGALHAGQPAVAAASARANRVVLAMPYAGVVREAGFGNRSWPGSVVLTGLLPGETPDTSQRYGNLFAGTEYNGPPAAEQLTRLNLGALGQSTVADTGDRSTGGHALRRGNALVWQDRLALGFTSPAEPGKSSFLFHYGTPDPRSANVIVPDLPEDALWLQGRFASVAGRSAFLFYTRGTSRFTPREAASVNGASPPVFSGFPAVEAGSAIHLLVTVEQPDGQDDRILALLDGGSKAALWAWRNGGSLTTLQTWTAPPGETFTQAMPLGNGSLLLLHGAGGRSTAWKRLDPDGQRVSETLSGGFHCGLLRRRNATLFYFSQEPFVHASAKLNRTGRESDWTDVGSGLLTPVTLLTDGGARAGLGQARGWLPPPGNYDSVLITNQFTRTATGGQAPVSLATLSNSVGSVPAGVQFDPPSGSYPPLQAEVEPDAGVSPGPGRFPVTLSNAAGAAMSWRLSPDDPWNPYTGPIALSGSSLLLAKLDTSPRVQTSAYTFARTPDMGGPLSLPPAQDLDQDGLPDAWEDSFAEYNPDADSDGDGRTARQEYQEGTDPRDAFSVTPPATVVPTPEFPLELGIVAAPAPRSGGSSGGRVLKLYWDARLAGALLESSTDLRSWVPAQGLFKVEGNQIVHTTDRLPDGLQDTETGGPPRFYRLVKMPVCE